MTDRVRAIVFLSLLAVVALLVFVTPASHAPNRVLEVRMRSADGAVARLMATTPSGFHSQDVPLSRTPDDFQVLRFPLPDDRLDQVQFMPTDRPGDVLVEQVRVLDGGATVRTLNVRSFLPLSQISSMKRDGRAVRIVTDAQATAPTLSITPACLDERRGSYALSSVTPVSLTIAAVACAALLAFSMAILVVRARAAAAGARPGLRVLTWPLLLVMLVVCAKLLLIRANPAPVPYLDQWDAEAANVYVPFDEGCLTWRQMFGFHNEHRIFFARLLALGLLTINGQWDPQLQQIVNALFPALTALALAVLFRQAGDRRLDLVIACCLLMFLPPFGWENTLAGLQSCFYLLVLFTVLSLALTTSPTGSWGWCAGWLCTMSSLFTTAGGLFTPVAATLAAGLRLFAGHSNRRDAVVDIGLGCAMIAFGVTLTSPLLDASDALKPHTFGEWLTAFARNLAWPWSNLPWMAVAAWMPMLTFVGVKLRQRRAMTDRDVLTIALGSWVVFQAAGLAYARGTGGAAPASRYMDVLSPGLLVNAVALVSLLDALRAQRPASRLPVPLLAAWCICAVLGMARATEVGVIGAAERATWMVTYQRSIRTFLADDDIDTFATKPFPYAVPYWSPRRLANAWLRHPYVRQILPTAVLDQRLADQQPPRWGSVLANVVIANAWALAVIVIALTAFVLRFT